MTTTTRTIRIHDENDRLIKKIELPKEAKFSTELVESILGRKLKAGEMIVFNYPSK